MRFLDEQEMGTSFPRIGRADCSGCPDSAAPEMVANGKEEIVEAENPKAASGCDTHHLHRCLRSMNSGNCGSYASCETHVRDRRN